MAPQRPLRILLVQPRTLRTLFGQTSRSGKAGVVRLGLPVLHAATPKELASEVRIFDMRTLPRDYRGVPPLFDEPWDLVGISALTSLAPAAYELADRFRGRGATVVLGGVHPTFEPDEALAHADIVVQGPGETVWPQVVRDVAEGAPRKVYDGRVSRAAPCAVPFESRLAVMPRPGPIDSVYSVFNLVQAGRGCAYNCDFCSVAAFSPGYRVRPVEDVLDEVRDLRRHDEIYTRKGRFLGLHRRIGFLDDSIISNRDYAMRLFEGLRGAGVVFDVQTTASMARDRELLGLAASAGLRWVSVGFESIEPGVKDAYRKTTYAPHAPDPALLKDRDIADQYVQDIAAFHRAGVNVMGSFVFGFDWDTPEVFDHTRRFLRRAGLDIGFFNLLTPYPGTRLRERLMAEGRVLTHDWSLYSGLNVTIRPLQMTAEQMWEGFLGLWDEFYRMSKVLRRAARLRRGFIDRLYFGRTTRRKVRWVFGVKC